MTEWPQPAGLPPAGPAPLRTWMRGVLQTIRVLAVLVVLFGTGAAGNSFESQINARGQDTGVFGGGVLAILGLKDPPDGNMFPVWVGRACVVGGIVAFGAITRVLDRAKRS